MKKQELIHLHGLLAEVSNHFENRMDQQIDCSEYEDQSVRPTSIHKSKTEHKDAVFALAKGITGAIEGERDEPVPAAAD
jgi:hypothetical protein